MVFLNSYDILYIKLISMEKRTMNCPKCNSSQFVKNGHTHYGKQRFRCQACGRQFVINPSGQPISQETRGLIEGASKNWLIRNNLRLRSHKTVAHLQ